MKHFIFKIFLLSTFIITFIFTINTLYVRTNYWKSENDVNKFDSVPYNIELGNVGSSHGHYGLKYDAVPEIQAFNFAMESQPYFYDYAMLNKYIDHFKENAVVLILVSYFEITRRPDLDYQRYRARYYRLLPKDALDAWTLKEYICCKMIPVFSAKKNIKKIFHDIPKDQMSPYYNRVTSLDEEKLYAYCVNKHKRWTSPEREKGQEGYRQNINEVSNIIELCLKHKIRPVLITTPISDVLNEIYKKRDYGFFSNFEQFTADLQKKYPGLQYFDYSRDKRFSTHHEYFGDGDHLNNIGAEVFTKTLVSELQSTGLLATK
ncbi:MAG: hypothetical protein J6I53_00825 [Treponema sp.]|nr:hypothetical protein [Treponema sp.]MBR1721958.1 hypothetical protein [Treponema sp.]